MTDAERLWKIHGDCRKKVLGAQKPVRFRDVGTATTEIMELVAAELKRQGWRPKGKV